jgi:multidrug efflux pump subunit AcrA (membrane-fusion protein)
MNSTSLTCLLISSLGVSSCSQHASSYQKIQPAQVERASHTDGVPKLTLTADARRRLGIESRAFPKDRDANSTIPTSALIYDTQGSEWVFVESQPFQFHREKIRVLQTNGGQIQIHSGFGAETPIVIQGAAELNGTESGVGK